MLCATALVLFMTMPGLAIYYSGMTREKNVLHCVMQVFTICSLITVLWLIFGYSLAFSPTNSTCQGMGNVNAVYGSGQRLWLVGMGLLTSHQLAPTIPEALFCAYQLTFAIITAALICGSFAERLKFVPMILFIALWHLGYYLSINKFIITPSLTRTPTHSSTISPIHALSNTLSNTHTHTLPWDLYNTP